MGWCTYINRLQIDYEQFAREIREACRETFVHAGYEVAGEERVIWRTRMGGREALGKRLRSVNLNGVFKFVW
jgi:hypothetical protein